MCSPTLYKVWCKLQPDGVRSKERSLIGIRLQQFAHSAPGFDLTPSHSRQKFATLEHSTHACGACKTHVANKTAAANRHFHSRPASAKTLGRKRPAGGVNIGDEKGCKRRWFNLSARVSVATSARRQISQQKQSVCQDREGEKSFGPTPCGRCIMPKSRESEWVTTTSHLVSRERFQQTPRVHLFRLQIGWVTQKMWDSFWPLATKVGFCGIVEKMQFSVSLSFLKNDQGVKQTAFSGEICILSLRVENQLLCN
jgi:hypothetical protein